MITLEEGEKIMGIVRKHWWILFTWGFGLFVMAVLPIIVGITMLVFAPDGAGEKYFYIGGFLYSIWLSALWVIFFIEWTDYYLDVWVITDKRVVDIEHMGLFNRETSTVRFEDIEDITIEVHGIIPTLLRYGTITIQTAGSQNEFYIRNATNPEKAKEEIYTLINASRASKGGVND